MVGPPWRCQTPTMIISVKSINPTLEASKNPRRALISACLLTLQLVIFRQVPQSPVIREKERDTQLPGSDIFGRWLPLVCKSATGKLMRQHW